MVLFSSWFHNTEVQGVKERDQDRIKRGMCSRQVMRIEKNAIKIQRKLEVRKSKYDARKAAATVKETNEINQILKA